MNGFAFLPTHRLRWGCQIPKTTSVSIALSLVRLDRLDMVKSLGGFPYSGYPFVLFPLYTSLIIISYNHCTIFASCVY